jgi:protein ImuB
VKGNPAKTRSNPNSQQSTADVIGILHKWGIHTLGQLAALDKEELRDRLGSEAVRLWEQANGTAMRLLKLVQPPETFDESFEFDHEIETAEPLLFILRRFLEQLALRLSSIYLVVRELTLTITFSKSEPDGHFAEAGAARTASAGKETHIRVFKIPQPSADVDLLFRMLQTHLENFKSEHPIVAVALSAEPIRPVSQQFGLFEAALRNPHQLYETLARLSALVGNDRVGTPVLEETHRPDAFRMERFAWVQNDEIRMSNGKRAIGGNRPYLIAADTAASTTHKCDGQRPPLQEKPALRRFRPPANTSIFISKHRHIESDKVCGQIVDQAGPFLLSGNWWDEKTWARAEWDMQLESGELIRAHECPRCEPHWRQTGPFGVTASAHGTWRIDGIYD